MAGTVWSIIPPLIAIIMVLLTKRVLLSLGIGILFSALFVANFQPITTFSYLRDSFFGVFWDNGQINTWNVFILLFILMLGVITTFVTMTGGAKAFGDWMMMRVKTKVGAQLMTMVLGIIVFIDDYFNSLAVGQVARPLTDRHHISRAKLAYIVDSTAAPICVISPISSWGAYIIGLIGSVFMTIGITGKSALGSFIEMIPMNFYVWAALGFLFIIIVTKKDFGPMKHFEQKRMHSEREEGMEEQFQPSIQKRKLPINENGTIRDLFIPIIGLFLSTIIVMYMNGKQNLESEGDLIQIFGSADVSLALLYGGLFTVCLTMILLLIGNRKNDQLHRLLLLGIKEGSKSMVPALLILVFAWMITSLIDELKTGAYLAGVIETSNLNPMFLPFMMFITAGFIALSTGTSWGSFALLLPIAGTIAANTEPSLILPMMASVLAGAVFGDHCSPISDTTILSSTGANCHHIDHVTTQLPYALTSATIASIGYLVLGLTGNVWVGFATVFLMLIAIFLFFQMKTSPKITDEKKGV
ncbi:Na+/H+ antiporter NhaC family protein [Fervidibacillus halotolerans]|uniref:Na+/H+ antiporter NhaC family protein n=1 Tax=Fervidibacillus halotolerans TaxID=2980027 RepID=A0A9E8M0X9_9BACI|nr:Na+/H+ antiporter NhaC family protein [Fervidibacillus halotolerans]WAA13483.1 Na+/H+ antiporter NhaC family protein [Fervidibacillus halotolerans]